MISRVIDAIRPRSVQGMIRSTIVFHGGQSICILGREP